MTDSRSRPRGATTEPLGARADRTQEPQAQSAASSRSLATAQLVRELNGPAALVLAKLDALTGILNGMDETMPAVVKTWLATSLQEARKSLQDARGEAERIRSVVSQLRRLVTEEQAPPSAQPELATVKAAPRAEITAGEPPVVEERPEEAAEALSLPPEPFARPSEDAKVVLVIEDDAEIRFMVTRSLGRTYTVYQATDGQEAAELLEKIPNPDAVVCDIMMPRLDGLALAKRMRADARLSTIPILFLTARDRFQDVVEGINVGARHYLKKPVKLSELMEKVATVVGAPTFTRRS